MHPQYFIEIERLKTFKIVGRRRNTVLRKLFPISYQVLRRSMKIHAELQRLSTMKLVSSRRYNFTFRKVMIIDNRDEDLKRYIVICVLCFLFIVLVAFPVLDFLYRL